MQQKQLQMFPVLRENFQQVLSDLLQGLKLFLPSVQMTQLKLEHQYLIFKFVAVLINKNFQMLLNLAIKDVTNFTYVLDVIGEGISSMQSIPMVSCFEAVSLKRR